MKNLVKEWKCWFLSYDLLSQMKWIKQQLELQADIFDPASLVPILKGHDVVVSVLGFPKQLEETMTKFTESMSAIMRAMKEAGVGRVVTISAWYTDPNTREGQFMFDQMWTKVPGKLVPI